MTSDAKWDSRIGLSRRRSIWERNSATACSLTRNTFARLNLPILGLMLPFSRSCRLYLILLANKCHIDLPTAAIRKIKKNGEKYPVSKAYNSAKKYTKF